MNSFLNAKTGQSYKLFKVYAEDGKFIDRNSGRRYNLVKRTA